MGSSNGGHNTPRRTTWLPVAIAFAAAGNVTCTRPPDASARLVDVRLAVGGQTQLVYLPTTLARELGFFRDEGLNVDIEDLAGGAKALEALVGGSTDVVSGFYDHTIQMAAEGREMIAFVTMLRYPGLILVTSPQGGAAIKTIADLRGRVVGVTAAGSSSQIMLTYLLKRHGLRQDDVSLTSIGTAATAVAALERGKVDSGMMADPAFTMMVRRNPTARVLADLRSAQGVKDAFGTEAYPASVLYAKGDWVRSHRDTVHHLAHAILLTLQWMQTHSAQEIADRVPANFRGENQLLYVDALRDSMAIFSPDGLMLPEGADAVRQLLTQSMEKVAHASIDISKTYTNEFVR